MKKLFTLLLMIPLLIACSSSSNDDKEEAPNDLIGSWVLTKSYIDIEANDADIVKLIKEDWGLTMVEMMLEFKNDGKVIVTDLEDQDVSTALYSIKGNILTMSANGETETAEFSIKNNILTTKIDIKAFILEELEDEDIDTSKLTITKAIQYGEYKKQ